MAETVTPVEDKREIDRALPAAKLRRFFTWPRLALGLILLLSAWLECFQLDQEGYANTYYAAGVKSMLTSWHNFFFVSFDSAGFVSLDKPPLGFWIQAASAKLFGFSGLSLLLPEALAGVLSVLLLYFLVRRTFGELAGLTSALILALTPIVVVTDRNNTIDSLLILTLLLAAWAVTYATETGKLRWFLLGALAVGLGFNIKMLQAYLVVPAFALMYLLGSPRRWWTRLWHLACAGLVLLLVSLSWAIVVDLLPASARPYVSDSGTNSEISLILGYNGLGRVSSALISQFGALHMLSSSVDFNITPAFAPSIGDPGPLRLFNSGIAGQISWLLPLALFALLAACLRLGPRPWFPLNRRAQATLLWGGWLLTAVIYFSASRFFHLYYLVMLGPAIAAMAGIGLTLLWEGYQRPGWQGWLLPLGLLLTTGVQVYMLQSYADQASWLVPLLDLALVMAVLLLVVQRFRPFSQPWIIPGALGTMLLVLLLSPLVWDIVSLQKNAGSTWLPQAGPTASFGQGFGGFGPGNGGFRGGRGNGGQRPGNFGGGQGALTYAGPDWNVLDPGLVSYLLANQGHASYLVATTTSSYASLFILDTNQPVMALGGYQGWDKILTTTQLISLINQGTVRFFYLSPNSGQASGPPASADSDANTDLEHWISQSCPIVPTTLWQMNNGNFTSGRGFRQNMQLYDCASHR